MKLRHIFMLFSVVLVLSIGVSFASAKSKKSFTKPSLTVVTTIFPEYDWAKEILGDKISQCSLTLLLDNGVDLHSYQPTVQDIAKISDCDVFIYVGGESDKWVPSALKNARNKNMQVVNLLEVLGEKVVEEEIVEGMQAEEEDEEEESHSKEVSTFDDKDVEDRSLADWEGNWKSAYPLVLDGTLDEAWEEKAESGKMTAAEYKAYYTKGYESDIASIAINGNNISYVYENGKKASSSYTYLGYYIQHWSTGTKAAMYRFEANDKNAGAPIYIEFNDHMIEKEKAEHFHFRASNTSFDDIVDPENVFPTFFPSEMSGKEIAEHLGGGHNHAHHHHHDGDEEAEYDEHVWLSLRNAEILVKEIASAISKADSANASAYQANANAYCKKLSALDKNYNAVVSSAKRKTVLFGDRFPFRYLVDDYGISYYAAFVGCSAETEASFETVAFLSKKLNELKLPSVCQIESGDGKIARTIISTAKAKGVKTLTFDSLQSTTSRDIKKGASYLKSMNENLDVLKLALN